MPDREGNAGIGSSLGSMEMVDQADGGEVTDLVEREVHRFI